MTLIKFVPETIPIVFIGQGTLGQNQVDLDTEKFCGRRQRIDLN